MPTRSSPPPARASASTTWSRTRSSSSASSSISGACACARVAPFPSAASAACRSSGSREIRSPSSSPSRSWSGPRSGACSDDAMYTPARSASAPRSVSPARGGSRISRASASSPMATAATPLASPALRVPGSSPPSPRRMRSSSSPPASRRSSRDRQRTRSLSSETTRPRRILDLWPTRRKLTRRYHHDSMTKTVEPMSENGVVSGKTRVGAAAGRPVVPAQYQPELPLDRLILNEAPEEEHVPMDVVFVGGGPAGLAGALELARLVREDNEKGGGIGDIESAVLEKAESLGEHCLSGAVVKPVAFKEPFPDLKIEDFPFRGPVKNERVYVLTESRAFRIPTPPTMRNHGNYIASISEMVRWLGEKAEEAGINVLTGFPAASLLVDGDRVIGVRTAPSGLDRNGQPTGNYMPP